MLLSFVLLRIDILLSSNVYNFHSFRSRSIYMFSTILFLSRFDILFTQVEGIVAQWCNPLNLQPEQSGEVGSIPGRAS